MKIKLVMQEDWKSLPNKLDEIKERLKEATEGRVSLEIDTVVNKFSSISWIPTSPVLDKPAKIIPKDWLLQNLLPHKGDATAVVLQIPSGEWQGGGAVGWSDWLTNDSYFIYIKADEKLVWPKLKISYFVVNFLHEFSHFIKHYLKQPDDTHQHILKDRFDLASALKGIYMNQAKVVKSKNSSTVYICYPIPDMDYLNKKAALEGFSVPTQIPNTDTL